MRWPAARSCWNSSADDPWPSGWNRPERAGLARMSGWSVYIVRCADGTLYTGIAIDVARRLQEHNSNNRLGASYTRARRPVALVYQETLPTRSAAAKREYCIKQMDRPAKEALVNASAPNAAHCDAP